MRKKVLAANWKMYKTPDETRDYFRDFLPLVAGHDRDEIVVCPPYTDVAAALEAARGSSIAIGVQNVHWKADGAYTGEISAPMLLCLGVTHVIIGHSERRQYFGETDDTVNLRLKTALESGLTPICCVGEVLQEREAGLTDDVLRRQCVRAFHAISAKKAAKLIVAYEPVWAIGTGKTATPELAAEAHAVIRSEATEVFGEEFAGQLRILYGGSVKPDNAKALMSQEEIDGALVGGAGLVALEVEVVDARVAPDLLAGRRPGDGRESFRGGDAARHQPVVTAECLGSVRREARHYPTAPSMLSSIRRVSSTAYSIGRVFVIGSMKPFTIIAVACCSVSPRLIR